MAKPKPEDESDDRQAVREGNYNNFAMDLMDRDEPPAPGGAPGAAKAAAATEPPELPEDTGGNGSEGVTMTKTATGFSLEVPGKSFDEAKAALMDFFGLGGEAEPDVDDLGKGESTEPL